ncbi:energy transducer TonB [Oxalobacter paraformigenes]|uniref:TonB family domain-containing protein n=1 Tax=Oxalobacter paraformigenes TaxID=556268 RepID=C3X2T4_9BURK|nr:energy transducer TonB [Oxalobacter paraformigenes]EEO27520.2 TonB family domain-containing protein [Oxalobacter paraformigenes]
MNKADKPFVSPWATLRVSRESGICLVLALAVHLFFIGWIGWTGGDEKPAIAAPVMGVLVSGDGESGGRAGNRPGNGKKREGTRPEIRRPEGAAVASGAFPSGMKKDVSGKREGRKIRPDSEDRATSADGIAVPAEESSGAVRTEKALFGRAGNDGREKRVEPGSAGHSPVKGNAGKTVENGGGQRGGGSGNADGSGGTAMPYADAGFFSNPKPPYPAVSRRMGEEGLVLLSVYIRADGHVADVKVKRSSGFSRLDESALKTVRHWRYVPAKKDGRPVAFRYVQPIRFSLNDE